MPTLPEHSQPLLRLEVLTAGYEGRTVLSNVKLQVSPSEILTLVGHNGAGNRRCSRQRSDCCRDATVGLS